MNIDWLTACASIATIIGFVVVVIQQVKQSRDLEADIRAYLHLEIKKAKFNGNKEMVLLTIYNSGEVAAEEVFINADYGVKWFALNGSSGPEFSSENSKLRVLPGEELVFLLGPLKELTSFKTSGIDIRVSYIRVPGRKARANEHQLLSLEPHRYLIERKLH